jgi:hypothetical protein
MGNRDFLFLPVYHSRLRLFPSESFSPSYQKQLSMVSLKFRFSEVVRKIPMDTLTQTLLEEVDLILKERAAQQTDVPAPAGQS